VTEEFGHEGSPEETLEMKKSLLATVAAVALIAGTGLASAEGAAKEQPGMNAGPATKAEPEMKKGADIKSGAEMKAEPKAAVDNKADPKAKPTTTGQASEPKAKPSTTGQSSEPKASEPKSGPAVKSTADDKAPAAKSTTNERAAPAAGSSAQGTQAPPSTSTAQGSAPAGGGGAVNLTQEQKSTIRTTVLQSSGAPKVSRSQINFNISVGTVVPRTGVRFVTVPDTIVRIHPAWRGYSYFIVDDEIIIVEPSTFKIVAVLTV
jgi:type IV secretory pathway VirB10-like protein